MSDPWETLRLLADPSRSRILHLLHRGELAVGELQEILGLPQSRISTHLALLRKAQLVNDRRDGKKSFYSLARDLPVSVAGIVDAALAAFAARGLKGAVGTQLDQLTLFSGDIAKVAQLETRVLAHLGIPHALGAVGQVYPRSMDMEVVAALLSAASGPSSFAKTLRLMAGHELASEGFLPGQVGSSAMPHKMNARTCERINGFHVILRGHLAMAASLSGEQWNEGDVSCSVVRRVLLPDAFLAIDGLFEAFLTVLGQMEVNRPVIDRESRHYLPFLLTTTFLMEAVKAGAGREEAHEAIKEHAVAVAKELRTGKIERNDLVDRLAADARLRLPKSVLLDAVTKAGELTGSAGAQVDVFVRQAADWTRKVPESAQVKAGRIL